MMPDQGVEGKKVFIFFLFICHKNTINIDTYIDQDKISYEWSRQGKYNINIVHATVENEQIMGIDSRILRRLSCFS